MTYGHSYVRDLIGFLEGDQMTEQLTSGCFVGWCAGMEQLFLRSCKERGLEASYGVTVDYSIMLMRQSGRKQDYDLIDWCLLHVDNAERDCFIIGTTTFIEEKVVNGYGWWQERFLERVVWGMGNRDKMSQLHLTDPRIIEHVLRIRTKHIRFDFYKRWGII